VRAHICLWSFRIITIASSRDYNHRELMKQTVSTLNNAYSHFDRLPAALLASSDFGQDVHTRASVTRVAIRYWLNGNGAQWLEWRKIKAAYCWVYDKCHLWPDCIARFPLSCSQKISGPFHSLELCRSPAMFKYTDKQQLLTLYMC